MERLIYGVIVVSMVICAVLFATGVKDPMTMKEMSIAVALLAALSAWSDFKKESQ